MNLQDLTVNQLRRAAAIKQQIEDLNRQLERLLGAPVRSGAASNGKRTISSAARRKIAAAQRARWAKLRSSRSVTSSKRASKAKKKMSSAARAKLSAKMKAYWAAKKSGKK
jgi:hypothetical protein